MARPRSEERAGWPMRLREPRPGYFTYRSPITGKEVSFGQDFAKAKREASRQNLEVQQLRAAKRKMVRDSVHGVRDQRGLLEPSHLAAEAMLYDSVTGVYFLLNDDEVVYVGKSTDVLRRLSQHRLDPDKTFNRVYLLPCASAEMARLEAMYIDKYRPMYNTFVPAVDPKTVAWRGTFSTVLSPDAAD